MALCLVFNRPEEEAFCCVKEVVLVSELLFNLCRLCPRVTRNDPVYEAVAEITCIFNPCCELFLKLPVCCMLEDIFLKGLSILVDEFARNEKKTF